MGGLSGDQAKKMICLKDKVTKLAFLGFPKLVQDAYFVYFMLLLRGPDKMKENISISDYLANIQEALQN